MREIVIMFLAAGALFRGNLVSAQVLGGDPAAGHLLARSWCSSCHAVEPAEQKSPYAPAPSFTAVAQLPSTTATALRVFLQTPHARMPNIKLSQDQIDDVAAYILSLRTR